MLVFLSFHLFLFYFINMPTMNYVLGRYKTRFSMFSFQCSLSKPPRTVLSSDGMLRSDHKSKSVVIHSDNALKLRVAHQGVQGAYSEAAAMKAFPGCEMVPVEKFEDTIIALAQCELSLKKLGVVRRSVDNTAGAAKAIASQKIRENGAIASIRAAEIYNLHILAHKFQDKLENVTRFLILAREPEIYTCHATPYKTSIVFTLHGGPGALAEALSGFYLRGINLCKIESRPLRKHPSDVYHRERNTSDVYFDYFFYIDFKAYIREPRAQFALEQLQGFTKYFRILGCYPLEEITERTGVSKRLSLDKHCVLGV